MSEEAPIVVTLKIPGASGPWVVLRSSTPAQAIQQCDAVAASGLGDAIGRADAALAAAYAAGAVLGARTEDPNAGQAAWDAPQQPQNTIQAAPPQNFEQPQAYGQQQAYPPAQQAYAPPAQAYQPPPQQAAPAGVPGAPMVQGVPAKLVQNKPGGKPWSAWADPRSQEATAHMEKTDDPNHPGLNAGTHKLWMFIR